MAGLENIAELGKICVWNKISRKQIIKEISRGRSLKGVEGYKETGCYECSGLNRNCDRYMVIGDIIK